MNISDYSVITRSDNPYVQGRVQGGGAGRERARAYADRSADESRQANNTERVQSTEAFQQSDSIVRSTRAIVPVGSMNGNQARNDFYQIEDLSKYTSNQRKALQTYSANQGLSMLDANADYLGAVDTYA